MDGETLLGLVKVFWVGLHVTVNQFFLVPFSQVLRLVRLVGVGQWNMHTEV